jgi:hypothetical protein
MSDSTELDSLRQVEMSYKTKINETKRIPWYLQVKSFLSPIISVIAILLNIVTLSILIPNIKQNVTDVQSSMSYINGQLSESNVLFNLILNNRTQIQETLSQVTQIQQAY